MVVGVIGLPVRLQALQEPLEARIRLRLAGAKSDGRERGVV
jgi:hypothetical protein